MNFVLHSSAAEDTLAVGRRLGLQLRGREIILVSGELAAGKTVLIKGIAAALEISDTDVVSPSYVLMNKYQGIHPMFHFDLYRLGGLLAGRENPIDEFLGAGVVAVEWAQYLSRDYFSLADAIAVNIEPESAGQRRITVNTVLSYISLA